MPKVATTAPPSSLKWEVHASGWPPPSKLTTAVGSVVLTVAALASMAGGTLDYTFAQHAWSVPLVLPLLVVLALLQAYRVARWRSTLWGLTVDGQALRIAGVFRRKVVYATSSERTPSSWLQRRMLLALRAGPISKLLTGLTDDTAHALAEALRTGDAPEQLPCSTGRKRNVFGILLYAAVLTSVAWGVAEVNRRGVARVQQLSALSGPCVEATSLEVDALLLQVFARRVDAEASLNAEQRSETVTTFSLVNNAGSSWSSGGGEFRWRIKRSLPTVLPVRGAWHDEVPCVDLELSASAWQDGLLIERFDATGPENQRFIDLLLPRLDQAGVVYELADGPPASDR